MGSCRVCVTIFEMFVQEQLRHCRDFLRPLLCRYNQTFPGPWCFVATCRCFSGSQSDLLVTSFIIGKRPIHFQVFGWLLSNCTIFLNCFRVGFFNRSHIERCSQIIYYKSKKFCIKNIVLFTIIRAQYFFRKLVFHFLKAKK